MHLNFSCSARVGGKCLRQVCTFYSASGVSLPSNWISPSTNLLFPFRYFFSFCSFLFYSFWRQIALTIKSYAKNHEYNNYIRFFLHFYILKQKWCALLAIAHQKRLVPIFFRIGLKNYSFKTRFSLNYKQLMLFKIRTFEILDTCSV